MVGVPWRAAIRTLAENGTAKLDQQEDSAKDEGRRVGKVENKLRCPAELGNRNGGSVSETRASMRAVLCGGPQPLEHQCKAHDHVAKHHDGVIDVLATLDRGVHPREADREDQ